MPHPQEAAIRAQNAERISRRAAASSLAANIAATSGSDLDRFGDRRQVGGSFRSIQKVPKRKAPKSSNLDRNDITALIEALSFGSKRKRVGRRQFQSSFGPGTIGLNLTGADNQGADGG